MSVANPVGAAEQIFRDLGGFGVEESPPPYGAVIEAVRRFEPIEFDVPDAPDADGFLFQYGTFKWLPEPAFVLSFVRQLEVVSELGDHECYVQLQCEFSYRVDEDLESIGRRETWWFRGGEGSFDEWLSSVNSDPVWEVVRPKSILRFSISHESV